MSSRQCLFHASAVAASAAAAKLELLRAGRRVILVDRDTPTRFGGLCTDLQSRVLDAQDKPIAGLYCVGEAAGFDGGGANGKRSLEGTFLPACILAARVAARSIAGGG